MKNKILNTKLLSNQTALFYLGQVGFIIKTNDKYILIDGYLSDYVDRNCSNELVTWKRRYAPPISPNELDFIDYVFCTHTHYDHADPDTLSIISKINPKARFFVSAANKKTISSYGIEAEKIFPLHIDTPYTIENHIKVTPIKSSHEELHQDRNGDYYEIGFIFDLGSVKIYHAGDCCMYDGLEKSLDGCEILLLPINGNDYYRKNVLDIIGCFDSNEALTLAKNIKAKLIIPTHFDLYDVNCVNPAVFVDTLNRINPTQKFHIFIPGEGFIYSPDLY